MSFTLPKHINLTFFLTNNMFTQNIYYLHPRNLDLLSNVLLKTLNYTSLVEDFFFLM